MNLIVNALVALDITADKLFESIKKDIERGLLKEAMERLNFVDLLLEKQKEKSQ